MAKTERPKDSKPAPIGELLPRFDADREPDFAGPEGPAKFSKAPDRMALLPVELEPLWHQRATTLAKRDGLDVSRYVEELIRQKWVLGPMAHQKPR